MKRVLSMLAIVALLACCCAGSAEEATKEATYQRALEFVANGQYDMAISVFEMLGEYKDSAAQIAVCQNAKSQSYYDRAVELFNDGEYDAAKEVFLMLGSYGDSAVQAIRCDTQKKQDQYDVADALAREGEYELAREAFLLLGDFSDSAARVAQMDNAMLQAQYDAALVLETSGDYEGAAEAFRALGEFGDAAAHVEACNREIAVLDVTGRVWAALGESPFDAAATCALLEEAQALGIDARDWYEEVYDLETYEAYGGAARLDEDVDGDGQPERIVATDGALVTLRRTPSGLEALSSVDGPWYDEMRVESDPTGRKYLVAGNYDTVDVYLLGAAPALICSESVAGGDAALEFTASGFVVSFRLTEEPRREAKREYVVLDADNFSAIDYPVAVDMETYPSVDSAWTLVTLYREASAYDSQAELERLESPDADAASIAAIRDWLGRGGVPDRAELIVWNEDEQDFTCIVDSAGDRLVIRVVQGEDGELAIRGM